MKIRKKEMKKDAVRVNTWADMPRFLVEAGAIVSWGGKLHFLSREGLEEAPFGSVIAWEPSQEMKSGWNVWALGPDYVREKLEERPDGFYTRPVPVEAEPIDDTFPEFLRGANISRNADGSWSVKTDWGVSTGFPGRAYWVRYGTKGDGTPDCNILTKGEKSYEDYLVCDEKGGEVVGRLADIDPA